MGPFDFFDKNNQFSRNTVRRIVEATSKSEKAPVNQVPEFGFYPTRRANDHFRLIRGRSVGNQSGAVIYLDNIIALSHGIDPSYGDPGARVPIANTIFPRSFLASEWVDAIYNPGVVVISGTGTDAATVDWETLPTGSGVSSPVLRRFELTRNKHISDPTGSGRFLDDDNNMVGAETILYDPETQWSGRAFGDVYGSSPAFRGVALLRIDLGTSPQADRWEIVEMESFAEFISVRYMGSGVGTGTGVGAGTAWRFRQNLSDEDPWMNHYPSDPDHNDRINLQDPISIAQNPVDYDLALARLYRPDGNDVLFDNRNPIYIFVSIQKLETDNLYVATFDSGCAPRNGTELGGEDAIVYKIVRGGGLILIGSRKVWNPFISELPATSDLSHPCAVTIEDGILSEFTLTGLDVFGMLSKLTGGDSEKVILWRKPGATGVYSAALEFAGTSCGTGTGTGT